MLSTQAASRQYAERPADERFPSLQALTQSALDDKNLSAERTYNLKDLRVVAGFLGSANEHPTVKLASPKGEAIMSHWAFGQLCRTLGAPAAYLRELSQGLAADCLNEGLSTSGVGASANLLVRAANGQPPTVRACTSESYGRVWDADLYGEIGRALVDHDAQWTLPPTWSGEPAGAYRGDRDSFLILTNGGSIVSDPSLTTQGQGDMYRGLLVRNSEVGASSLVIEQILYRYVCGNHMLWGAVIDRQYRRRHVGTRVLRDTVREISSIAFRWTQHSTERDNAIIRGLIDHEIASTKEAVIDELRALGATAEQATAMYVRCEQTESVSPRSFWGIAQGATRVSQDSQYQDERYQLDRLAAQVMARGAKLVRV